MLSTASLFPVKPLRLAPAMSARSVYRKLLEHGVQPVLHREAGTGSSRISFVLSARHALSEIDYAVASLTKGLREEVDLVGARSDLRPR